MELYELNANKKQLLVYELRAYKNRVMEYKEEQLSLIKPDLYTLETTDKKLIANILRGSEIDNKEILLGNYEYYIDLYKEHQECLFEREKKQKICEDYLNGNHMNIIRRTFKDGGEKTTYDFLITEDSSSFIVNNQDYYKLGHMLSLPADLAALHYLEQGKFNVFNQYERLAREIPFQLFEIDYIEQISASFLNLEIVNSINSDIKGRAKVLTLYRASQDND